MIRRVIVGQIETNCYLLSSDAQKLCVIVDPGGDPDSILFTLKENELTPLAILLTHGHFDHTGGIHELCLHFPELAVYLHADEYSETDPTYHYGGFDSMHFIKGGDILRFGPENEISLTVLDTPGHTSGGVSFLAEDPDNGQKYLFAGDTLFAGSAGRTDLPGGNMEVLLQSLKKLYEIDGDYIVLSGHGDPSMLSHERKTNPYMQYALRH